MYLGASVIPQRHSSQILGHHHLHEHLLAENHHNLDEQYILIASLPNVLVLPPTTPHPNPYKQDMLSTSQRLTKLVVALSVSSGYLTQHFQDIALKCLDIRLDFFQRAWRLVFVKIAIEVDLVSNFADFAILMVTYSSVHPCIRHIRLNFTLEVGPDILIKRHILSIAQF